MERTTILRLRADGQGNLVLPRELVDGYGLSDGAKVRLEEDATGFRISRSTDNLARIYVEPTNICNLACRTCMRHGWEEPLGRMDAGTFQRILEGVAELPIAPEIFFGGFGEPLSHPGIVGMVEAAKAAGSRVELITNGVLLTPEISSQLIRAGLDRLWVSLDGATPESYADVRLGAELPRVLAHLEALRTLKYEQDTPSPKLGIAFVAMKRNLDDLPKVIDLGKRVGADSFSFSNVLPHTPPMLAEALYRRPHGDVEAITEWSPRLAFPRMELSEEMGRVLLESVRKAGSVSIVRQGLNLGTGRCPFAERGSTAVRWDGAVSPCLALLHDHENLLGPRSRKSLAHAVGHLRDRGLLELWRSPDYVALRERVLAFDFSFCTECNSCALADSNQEDCFGNVAPTCGACLWAQGLIQCP